MKIAEDFSSKKLPLFRAQNSWEFRSRYSMESSRSMDISIATRRGALHVGGLPQPWEPSRTTKMEPQQTTSSPIIKQNHLKPLCGRCPPKKMIHDVALFKGDRLRLIKAINCLHSVKLTEHLKLDLLKRRFLLETTIFTGYVSFFQRG